MPRFVILEHNHPELHWDFMLEAGEVLRTWRLCRPPETPGEGIDALALPDHRHTYLDYEGPVSGGRGVVRRWDAGTFEDCGETLRLAGQRVRGVVRLTELGGERWRFEWREG